MAILWLRPEDTIEPNGPYTLTAIRAASWILYKLTAEKYSGVTSTTETYETNSTGFTVYRPQVIRGKMYNLPIDGSGVVNSKNLYLRHYPVLSVEKVSVNGIDLDPSEYELRNNSFITRVDNQVWSVTATNNLTVTYRFGTPPPSVGKYAAIMLANEFILAKTSPEDCSLPSRVTSVSRQGVSYTILDPQTYISEGKTGIYEVDLFINAANPLKAKKRPKVYSPDVPSGERRN